MPDNSFDGMPRPQVGQKAGDMPDSRQPKSPGAVRQETLALNAARGTASSSTARRRLAGMIGALGLLAAAGFLAWPVAFESPESETNTSENSPGDAQPAVSLGKKTDKYRAEDAVPDVGSLVWRDPSEKTLRRQKEARRRAAAEVKLRPQTKRTAQADQLPVVVRGRTIVRTAVEDGPMLGAPETGAMVDVPTSRQTAQQLVREARTALTEGRIDEAKQIAIAADRLNVAFALFEDRPAAILSEIAKLQSSRQETQGVGELETPAAPVLTDPIPIDPPAPAVPEMVESSPALESASPRRPQVGADADLGTTVPTSESELPTTGPRGSSIGIATVPRMSEPELVRSAPRTPPTETVTEPIRTVQVPVEQEQQRSTVERPLPQVETQQIRIMPGENRNPIPDDGVRLSFDFHAAPWDFVLTQFAAKVRRPIDMTLVPAGTLTYTDHQVYSAQETLNILNVLLIEKGFTMIHRDGRLVLKPQPSAISSRTDGPTQEESELAKAAVESKVRAAALLSEARRDISNGNLDGAIAKARRAASLNAVFGLLEDRPETVLHEIRRVALEPQQLMPEGPASLLPSRGDPWLNEKRMSINFKDAGWDLVLREFAKSAGLDLLMESSPPGTFSHVDTGLYSPAETLEVLNGFLSRVGFQAVREGNSLRVTRIEPVLRGLR